MNRIDNTDGRAASRARLTNGLVNKAGNRAKKVGKYRKARPIPVIGTSINFSEAKISETNEKFANQAIFYEGMLYNYSSVLGSEKVSKKLVMALWRSSR